MGLRSKKRSKGSQVYSRRTCSSVSPPDFHLSLKSCILSCGVDFFLRFLSFFFVPLPALRRGLGGSAPSSSTGWGAEEEARDGRGVEDEAREETAGVGAGVGAGVLVLAAADEVVEPRRLCFLVLEVSVVPVDSRDLFGPAMTTVSAEGQRLANRLIVRAQGI